MHNNIHFYMFFRINLKKKKYFLIMLGIILFLERKLDIFIFIINLKCIVTRYLIFNAIRRI